MSALDNLLKSIKNVTQEAKKTYDAKKLEQRIKNYRKEETELYAKLGKFLYESYRSEFSDPMFDSIFGNLDAIKTRMKHLDRQITDIRNHEELQCEYARLDRKDSDLTLTRTKEGIRLIRLCPECQAPNDPEDSQCSRCQRLFE